jgi:dUTP pyrophosphatase
MHRTVVPLVGDGKTPTRAYRGDAGSDLYTMGEWIALPNTLTNISTGVRVRLPEGFYARIVARSGTLRKYGILVNEGIIDNGYTGELFVCVFNPNDHEVIIPDGDRLAQLILCPIVDAQFERVEILPTTERGERGFGSSGR